jgi:opacity protein-like surface antigen
MKLWMIIAVSAVAGFSAAKAATQIQPVTATIECFSDTDCPCNYSCRTTVVADACGREVPDGNGGVCVLSSPSGIKSLKFR